MEMSGKKSVELRVYHTYKAHKAKMQSQTQQWTHTERASEREAA